MCVYQDVYCLWLDLTLMFWWVSIQCGQMKKAANFLAWEITLTERYSDPVEMCKEILNKVTLILLNAISYSLQN